MSTWQDEWQPLVDAVGQQFGDDQINWGADPVELGTIRRYLEPLEVDSALHYDAEVARAHGYADVIAPYTQIMSYAVGPMWRPGEPTLYDSAEPDAQPARSPINNEDMPLGPKTTGFFATDIAMDFIRPLVVGERVGRRGRKLVSCSPKETSMGRGAFMTWESELVTNSGEVVAYVRTGTYAYNPHGDS
ncbi:MAG TPA: MaoC family dehydratase N-terminal domain-containing protein [Jatrophihabitans sp.]|nr:MaoC family dehydratase N-terminal domain-containing protein [Jatrophihabitans sp.]